MKSHLFRTEKNTVLRNLKAKGFKEANGYPREAKTFKIRNSKLYVNHGSFVSVLQFEDDGRIRPAD